MKIYNRNEISCVWYDVGRTEVNIELENGTFAVIKCYSDDDMYRNYDRVEWCLEHNKPFKVYNDCVVICWDEYD